MRRKVHTRVSTVALGIMGMRCFDTSADASPLVCLRARRSGVLPFSVGGKCVWVCARHAALQLPCSLKR